MDVEKLKGLVDTLSNDQKQLLREGLAHGENLDPVKLADAFSSAEHQDALARMADDGGGGGEPGLSRW